MNISVNFRPGKNSMSWGLLLRRHVLTLWMRLKTLWLTRQFERKQRAARGVVSLKHPNGGKPIHVRSGRK